MALDTDLTTHKLHQLYKDLFKDRKYLHNLTFQDRIQ